LDGQARKWFKELPENSVAGIEKLDEVFLKHWGERRDLFDQGIKICSIFKVLGMR
jgi:hypothetical protein